MLIERTTTTSTTINKQKYIVHKYTHGVNKNRDIKYFIWLRTFEWAHWINNNNNHTIFFSLETSKTNKYHRFNNFFAFYTINDMIMLT